MKVAALLLVALSFIDAKNLRTSSSSTKSDVICVSLWGQCGGQLNGQPMVIEIIGIFNLVLLITFSILRYSIAALVDQYVTK